MSYEALQNLTVSSHGSATSSLLPQWLAEIESDGFAKVPVYHNVKSREDEVKSMTVRKLLATKFKKLYYVHGTDDDGNRFIVISNKTAVFTAMKWDYETHEQESE